ncbi:hypothetical protein NL676_038071 [Syzygium grande]|nr:hypothetical protein NL676_038071 [Syzygium grande]
MATGGAGVAGAASLHFGRLLRQVPLTSGSGGEGLDLALLGIPSLGSSMASRDELQHLHICISSLGSSMASGFELNSFAADRGGHGGAVA